MTETEIPTPETQEVLEPTIEDMIQAENGVPFTSSLSIAHAFGKEHKDVLRYFQSGMLSGFSRAQFCALVLHGGNRQRYDQRISHVPAHP